LADRFEEKNGPTGDIVKRYKDIGLDPDGREVHAEVVALEPGSIGGGGTGGGGTTQYAEDTPSVDAELLVMLGAKRKDVRGTDVSADGDRANLHVNANNELRVKHEDSIPVTGTFWQATQPVSGPLTDAQLRAAVVPVLDTAVRDRLPAALNANGRFKIALEETITVPVSGTFWQATQPVSGPLTDTQLRATAVPVSLSSVPTHAVTKSGTWTLDTAAKGTTVAGSPTSVATDANTQSLHAHIVNFPATQAVSGPLTDAQLRAAVVPVLDTAVRDRLPTALTVGGRLKVAIEETMTVPVSGTFWQATQPVSGPLTDAQLRATAVPVSGTFWQATQPISAASLPLPSGAAQDRTTAAAPSAARLSDGTAFYDARQIRTITETIPVSGPLTDAQLRASAVATSLASLPSLAVGDNRIGRIKITDDTNVAKVAIAAPASTDPGLVVHVASQPPGGGGGTVQYAEDTPSVDAEQLVMMGVKRKDVRGTDVSLDGDRANLHVNANNELRVKHEDSIPVTGTFWQTNQPVVGNTGDGTVDTGAPVKGGLRIVTGTPPLRTDGHRADLIGGARGSLYVTLMDPNNASNVTIGNPADADGNWTGMLTNSRGMMWNGASWDRFRGDIANGLDVDVTDKAARENGRFRIWDGVDEATVLPVRAQPATTEKMLMVGGSRSTARAPLPFFPRLPWA
jgi:hypothetical protein